MEYWHPWEFGRKHFSAAISIWVKLFLSNICVSNPTVGCLSVHCGGQNTAGRMEAGTNDRRFVPSLRPAAGVQCWVHSLHRFPSMQRRAEALGRRLQCCQPSGFSPQLHGWLHGKLLVHNAALCSVKPGKCSPARLDLLFCFSLWAS